MTERGDQVCGKGPPGSVRQDCVSRRRGPLAVVPDMRVPAFALLVLVAAAAWADGGNDKTCTLDDATIAAIATACSAAVAPACPAACPAYPTPVCPEPVCPPVNPSDPTMPPPTSCAHCRECNGVLRCAHCEWVRW